VSGDDRELVIPLALPGTLWKDSPLTIEQAARMHAAERAARLLGYGLTLGGTPRVAVNAAEVVTLARFILASGWPEDVPSGGEPA
jgi:hypothetical protein